MSSSRLRAAFLTVVVSLAPLSSGCHLFGGVDVPVGNSDLGQIFTVRDMNVAAVDMPPFMCSLNSCAMQKASCGPVGDGCGGVIQCGTCSFPQTCGGGGTPFQCGGMAACAPLTCASLGLGCGPAGDGCGNTIDCGGCPMGQTCGGGGVNGKCGVPGVSSFDMTNGGCTPRTCGTQDCGQIGDGCGKLVTCGPLNGMCPAGLTCGGGGQPGHCGKPACTPSFTQSDCAKLGYNCGLIGDGCNGTVDCSLGNPACASLGTGFTCGGGGKPNVCGGPVCVPLLAGPGDCAKFGYNCGNVGNGCGGIVNCGATCPNGTTCGGGNKPNVCGSPMCTPKSCAQVNANCGPVGDGCGNIIKNGTDMGCGVCQSPNVCGAFTPNVCGSNLPDGGVACDGGGITSISGTVLAATNSALGFGTPDPVPNATIFIPAKGANLALGAGATCDKCTNGVPALLQTTSKVDGTFTLNNPPTGLVTVVIRLGKWQRVIQTTVLPCTNNKLTSNQTRLPRVQSEFNQFDNIPRLALATGDVDVLECVLRKMGIDDSEFDTPNIDGSGNPTSTKRVHIYQQSFNANNGAPGAVMDANNPNNTPGDDQLWGNTTTIDAYDAVLFPCTGGGDEKPTSHANLQTYANAGGRIFTTHYGYVYLHDNPPWGCNTQCSGDTCQNNCTTAGQTTAAWTNNTAYNPQFDGFIDETFPKGILLRQWLQLLGVGGFAMYGPTPQKTAYQIPVRVVRNNFNSVINGQQWMFSENPPNAGRQYFPLHYTFNTPTTSQPADQCGRVVYSDFHVENTPGDQPAGCVSGSADPNNCGGRRQPACCGFGGFPACCGHSQGVQFPIECDANAPLTPQEKLLEFMLFDLTSCVSPDIPVCTPKTCTQLGYTCGTWGDGCGGTINCCPGGAQNCCTGGSVCQAGKCVGGCVPTTCAALGYACGLWGDGCGNTLNCCPGGTPSNGQCCASGKSCGGGGTIGQCGGGTCQKVTCATLGAMCGIQTDGCGGTQDCCNNSDPPTGTGQECCTNGQTCGGGGVPNQCGGGCKPLTCQQLGLSCGPAGDGCGHLINCCPNGMATCCSNGQTCGGGGTPGQCGRLPDGGATCTKLTCQQQGIGCGAAGDGCGGLLDCGPCPMGQTCGGGGTPGVCGAPNCTPTTCAAVGGNCGFIGDGCGGLLDCCPAGTDPGNTGKCCMAPETCGGSGNANVCGRIL